MSSTEKSEILHKKKGFKVNVDPQLVDRVYDVLDKFGVEPVVKVIIKILTTLLDY